jgi:hypothetical protein
MRIFFAATAMALAFTSAALGQDSNTAGTSGGNAPASSGLSGIDITQAGNTPQSQKQWFGALSRDEQAQIMQSCNDMVAANAKLTQQDTTGSVAARTTTNSAANVDSGMSETGMSSAQMKTFCQNIK